MHMGVDNSLHDGDILEYISQLEITGLGYECNILYIHYPKWAAFIECQNILK